MVGEFALGGKAIHDFDQIHSAALSALRKERRGFVVLLRGEHEEDPMVCDTAFSARGTSKQELRDFLEMVIEFAQREIDIIDALDL